MQCIVTEKPAVGVSRNYFRKQSLENTHADWLKIVLL